ncbi:MAG: AmmeMemoRadiSam system protein B, partial [Anaerolineae bacterium]
RMLVISRQLAPLLALMDGTRNVDELRASLAIRFGMRIGQAELAQFVDQLDDALLLHNERFLTACDVVLTRYRQATCRHPTSAGASYPADPDELATMLDNLLAAQNDPPQAAPFKGRGVISPHIDYERGGTVYAQVWGRATGVAREAEVAVIFGTDHNGGDGMLTLTRQNYATPYGVLPTATGVVDAVAEAVGPDFAFEEELHHIGEHSIELAAVWLHHVRQRQPIKVVPILCGSFHHFFDTPHEPASDPAFDKALEALTTALDGRPTLVVAAADLAHIGPAFGDSVPVDFAGRARLVADDNILIEAMCAGDAEAFYQQIKAENDQRNVCGLSPIYLTLRLLGETTGERAGYERCLADQNGTSWVSVCGVVLR